MLFPTFLKLGGRTVLLVGGGPVAAGKLRGLLDAGAAVRVVAPEVRQEILDQPVEVARRPFVPSDLEGIAFVVAAAPPAVNREVAAAADAKGLFVNAVDDVESASAYAGAVLRRAGVTMAISTDGDAPALAGLIREALEALLPDDLDRWMQCARESRQQWLAQGVPMAERRPLLLGALNDLYSGRLRPAGPLNAVACEARLPPPSREGMQARHGETSPEIAVCVPRQAEAGRSAPADAPSARQALSGADRRSAR